MPAFTTEKNTLAHAGHSKESVQFRGIYASGNMFYTLKATADWNQVLGTGCTPFL